MAILGGDPQRVAVAEESASANFADLPTAAVAVAGYDPLREEGLAYAQQTIDAEVTVHPHRFDEMFHLSLAFSSASAAARKANDVLCQDFAAILGELSITGISARMPA